jgi:hypothetical protein
MATGLLKLEASLKRLFPFESLKQKTLSQFTFCLSLHECISNSCKPLINRSVRSTYRTLLHHPVHESLYDKILEKLFHIDAIAVTEEMTLEMICLSVLKS